MAYQFNEGVFEGQHCQLPLRESGAPENPNFVMGVCIPAICRQETVYKIMNRFFSENVQFELTAPGNYHCTVGDVEAYGALQWTEVGLLIALGVGLLFSTVYDLIKQYQLDTPSNIMNSFSIYRNANALFSHTQKPTSPMSCLNGIRVLSMAWIVLYHAYQEYDSTFAIYNRNDIVAVNSMLNFFSFQPFRLKLNNHLHICQLVLSWVLYFISLIHYFCLL